MFIRIYLF